MKAQQARHGPLDEAAIAQGVGSQLPSALLQSPFPAVAFIATMQAVAARSVVVCQAGQAKAQKAAAPVSVVRPLKALGAGVASLALALSANAATVSFAGPLGASRAGVPKLPIPTCSPTPFAFVGLCR